MPFPTPKTSLAPVEDILMESFSAQSIIAALDMKLFDQLSHGPMSAAELAKVMGFKAKPVEALLDLLTHRKILEANGTGYTNSPMAEEYLLTTSPLYQGRAMAKQHAHNQLLQHDFTTLLKGEPARRQKTDDSWSKADTMDAMLQNAIKGQLQGAVNHLKELPEFPSFRTMADIGGSHGHYSMELMEHNPHLTSTIMDLPDVSEAASLRCKALGYAGRITCQPFDIRTDTLPEAAHDLVFISHMLYGCTDMLEAVFANIHQSLKPGGCFVSHHFAPEGGASKKYQTNIELITRLMGYDSHFITRTDLEGPLSRCGFSNMTHTFTGVDGQTLLLVARKDA